MWFALPRSSHAEAGCFELLVSDSSRVFGVPLAAAPGYLAPFRDRSFGTLLTRITGDAGAPIGGEGVEGTWGDMARQAFFTHQPWNADGRLLAIQNHGDPSLLLLDGETYRPLAGGCPGHSGDERWHPSLDHAHERIEVFATELRWYDVLSCQTTRSWALPLAVNGLGSGVGNPSADGRFVALSDSSRVFVVDMDPQTPFDPYPAERIGPALDVGDCGLAEGCAIEWVSISPSGKYVVVDYAHGGPRVFDVDPSTLALTPRANPAGAVSCGGGDPERGFAYDLAAADLALNPFDDDEDVLVGQEQCGNRGLTVDGQLIAGVVMVRLRDGAVTSLTDPVNEAYPRSVSARNDRRAGWVYVSYDRQDGARFSDEIVAVKLDGSRSVERIAHQHNASGACECRPQPVPSRDGCRVLWASNWADGCSPCGPEQVVSAMVADARSANRAPDGTIDLPPADTTIVAGDFLAFAASASDPDGEAVTFHWDFGGAAGGRDVEDPGPIQFCRPGRFTVTLTVNDAGDLADPSPATRMVTVIPPPLDEPAHGVHWTFTGQTSVTFDWRGGSSAILYGLTTCYDHVATAVEPVPLPISSPGPFREARLTGLLENTLYHYSIGFGPDHTFRTPPPRGSSGFDVCVTADIGSTYGFPRVSAIQSLIASDMPEFCLVPGDLTYGGPEQGAAAVEQHFDDLMVWSQDAAYMPAWGNHEYAFPKMDDLRNYKGRFDFPSPQTSPGSPAVSCCGEDWYWFDYGNARFIAYPEPWSGALTDWYKKADVLMDEAQADPDIDYIVTFGHRPAYSSGQHEGLAKLRGPLDLLGAEHPKYVLNVNGHSHDYERTYPLYHVTHVTAGGGGANLEEKRNGTCSWGDNCPPPLWSATRALHHGVLKLHFGPSNIEGWWLCGPAAPHNDIDCPYGSPTDHFVLDVRDHPPIVVAPARVIGVRDQELTIPVASLEPDGEPMGAVTTDLSGLPATSDASFTADSTGTEGTLRWTPSAEHVGGPYRVAFTASNALDGIATTEIQVLEQEPPKNLFYNSSFEGSLSGWSACDGGTLARAPGGLGGAWCGEIADATATRFGLNDSPNSVATTVAAGAVYRYSGWVRSANGSGRAYIRLRENVGGSQGSTEKSPEVILGPDWQPLAIDHVVSVAGSSLDFRLLCEPNGPGASFQVDSLTCFLVSTAAATVSGQGIAQATALDGALPPPPLVFSADVHPTPVVDHSVLSFTTTRMGPVKIALYGVDGRRIRKLMDEANVAPGRHEIDLRARAGRLMPGVYFYRLRAGEGTLDGRFVILQ
ncbi:MAG TPA: PKD domain-containing protein [Candidatus Eisenbacteria bacterium]